MADGARRTAPLISPWQTHKNRRYCAVMRRRPTLAGYTLLEILLVLLLVGVLVSVSLVSFRLTDRKRRLEAPMSQLQELARRARQTAVQKQVPYDIVLEKGGYSVGPRRYALREGQELWWKPWRQQQWRQAESYRWTFQPSGFCEPLSVRLQEGQAWVETGFHPLTAGVREERMEIP